MSAALAARLAILALGSCALTIPLVGYTYDVSALLSFFNGDDQSLV
jgi:hypothetical protein